MDLREQVYEEARRAMAEARGNPAKVDRGAIVKKFTELGAKRRSIFRWIALALMKRAAPRPDVENLPENVILPPLRISDISELASGIPSLGMGGSSSFVIEKLMLCIEAAADCMKYSRNPDGKVRITKSLIAASEHLRRCLETVVKLQESHVTLQKLDHYMIAIFDALGQASREVQAQALVNLRAVDAKWRAGGE